MRAAAVLAIFAAVTGVCLAATIHVPGDYATIQEAIDAATNGDTILVAPGTYDGLEGIDFLGKAVHLKSTGGPAVTVISALIFVVRFQNGEDHGTILEGFTVCNGAWYGGIQCSGASPVLRNNIIRDNTTLEGGQGGGIQCKNGSSPLIIDNIIRGNSVTSGYNAQHCEGGGIYADATSSPVIMNNLIEDNVSGLYSHYAYRNGGGIYCQNGSGALIVNNIVRGNSAKDYGGGILCFENAKIINNIVVENTVEGIMCKDDSVVLNNTVAYNIGAGIDCTCNDPNSGVLIANNIVWKSDNQYGQFIVSDQGTPIVQYCDVEGGWPGPGNIDADPLFVDPAGGDYHLTYPSPCRDAGDNAPVSELCDFEGDPRIAFGTADMGADEFHTHLYYTGDAAPGGTVALKYVDVPGTAPVGFWIAFNVLATPMPGAYGDWWLLPPMVGPITLSAIPASGVQVLSGQLPASPPGPYTLYFQAIMGTPLKLSNLCTVEVQ